jgi:hypothetical protein
MRNLVLLTGIFLSLALASQGQTIRDDGKITRRERRFVTKKVYGSDRAIRVKEWKNSRKVKKTQAKQEKLNRARFKQVNANKRDWGTKTSRKEHAKHYKAMKKSWFARDDSRKYVRETRYP